MKRMHFEASTPGGKLVRSLYAWCVEDAANQLSAKVLSYTLNWGAWIEVVDIGARIEFGSDVLLLTFTGKD